MLPLVLYDIPSKLPGKTWSANTAKARFVLAHKNLPFQIVWVEYCDIGTALKEAGASPNKLPDGKELYTVPVISDPNTGTMVTDSWKIAEYLDQTYPEKPIFPPGSKGLISAFDSALSALAGNSVRFGLLRSSQIMNERSMEHFVRIREVTFGEKYEAWSSEGPTRDAHWAIIKKLYDTTKTGYDKVEGKWLMGGTFSYADIALAARIGWFKRVFRDDEWKRVSSFHDGRWEKLLADVERECNIGYGDAQALSK